MIITPVELEQWVNDGKNFKVFDMRNLYSISEMKKNKINYFSIGR